MALEVYWGSGSPFSWRVLLTLEVKQLPYQSKLLTFLKQEHKSPEYLALNPRGKVPTLKEVTSYSTSRSQSWHTSTAHTPSNQSSEEHRKRRVPSGSWSQKASLTCASRSAG